MQNELERELQRIKKDAIFGSTTIIKNGGDIGGGDIDISIDILDMQLNNAALLEKLQCIVAQNQRMGVRSDMKFPLEADGGKKHYISIKGLIWALKITIGEESAIKMGKNHE